MSEKKSSHAQRFGEKLRILRKRHNLRREDLAEVLGYRSESYITYLENNKRKPSPQLIVEIAQYFGVSTDALLRDELEV